MGQRSGYTKVEREHHLGLFETEEEARLAYNKKATELYGEYHRQA